jgi:hypothetical protein
MYFPEQDLLDPKFGVLHDTQLPFWKKSSPVRSQRVFHPQVITHDLWLRFQPAPNCGSVSGSVIEWVNPTVNIPKIDHFTDDFPALTHLTPPFYTG